MDAGKNVRAGRRRSSSQSLPRARACGRSLGKAFPKLVARRNHRGLCAPPARNTKTVKNYPCRVGAIEGVKVNAGHVVIQKIVTLFQGEVNADAPDSFRIAFASLKSTQNSRREACSPCELRHAFQSAHGCNWHDTRDNGDVNAGERTTFAE